MKALQVVSRGKAEFIETAKPDLQPGHVLVRPHYVALCGSDIWMLHHGPLEAYPFPPGTSGHEVIAEVVAIDGDHHGFNVGDLTLTLAPDHRAMAEFYLAPVGNVLPLPPGKTPEELLMAQQLGTVLYGCRQLPNVIGQTVAVVGQGSAGLWFNVTLRRLGAKRIVAIDIHDHRLALSKRYGATDIIHALNEDPPKRIRSVNDGELADVVVEASGTEAAINLSIALAKPDEGFLLQFGLPRQPLTVDYCDMFMKCLNNKSIVHASRETGHSSTIRALELIGNGEVDVSPVLTHRFPFDEVLDAYELQRNGGDGAVKTIIEMNGPVGP